MKIHRRGFIAALFAPFVAKFLPKKVEFVPGSVAARPPILPFKIVTSTRQSPGRIDFINLKDWVRIEPKLTDYYDVDMRKWPLSRIENIKAMDARHATIGLYVPDRPWSKGA